MHLDGVEMTHPHFDNLYDVKYDEDMDFFHMGMSWADFRDGNVQLESW